MVTKEQIQLGDVLEDGYGLGDEGTDVLVVFVIGLCEEVGDVHDRDAVIPEEGGVKKALKETVSGDGRWHAMLACPDGAWPSPLATQDQSPGEKAKAWAAALGQKGRTIQRGPRPEQLRASGFDQIGGLNPAVGVLGGRQAFLLLTLLPGPAGRRKHNGKLRKYTDGVNQINVRDDVRVCLFVFEEERA